MKIAIVGTGAAAFGVAITLKEELSCSDIVTVFDVRRADNNYGDIPTPTVDRAKTIKRAYNLMRKKHGFQFPPPKFDFELPLKKIESPNGGEIWNGEFFGGLTNFWGAGAIPFPTSVIQKWGLKKNEMDPFYRKVALHMGIRGNPREFSNFFSFNYSNQPMIKVCESLADLHNRLSKKSRESRDFEIGVSNLAIATSELTSQGEEIWWQPRAAWNSACFFDDLFARDIRFNLVLGRVLKIKSGSVTYHDQISQKQLIQDGFDIIFVAAGCIGSTEIIIRSKDLGHRELEDNRTYSFPIIRPLAKIKLGKKTNDSVTLSNLTILGRTDKGDTPFMISIYPFPTHFLRYYLPKMFWKLADFLSRMIRQHLCLGRLCIGDQHNRRYSLAILDDKLSLEDKHECTPSNADLRSQVKKIFERTGFIALT